MKQICLLDLGKVFAAHFITSKISSFGADNTVDAEYSVLLIMRKLQIGQSLVIENLALHPGIHPWRCGWDENEQSALAPPIITALLILLVKPGQESVTRS